MNTPNESIKAQEGQTSEGGGDKITSLPEHSASPMEQAGSLSLSYGHDPERFSRIDSLGKIPVASFSGFLEGLLKQNIEQTAQQEAQYLERIRECEDCLVWYEDAKVKAQSQLEAIKKQAQQATEMLNQLKQLENEAQLNLNTEEE